MHRVVLAVALIIGAITASTASAAAEPATRTWEMAGRDNWQPVDGASATTRLSTDAAPANVPTLDRVEELLRAKKAREAKTLAIDWVLANRRHPQRDRGLYLIAQSLYQYGNRLRAFYYLDELMDTYPESPYYGPALETQFQIADQYLKGYKRRFFGVPMFHAYDEAIEMLFRIQHRSPGSQLAERALLRTANFYYRDEQYDFAADTYAHYLRSYPRSPITPRVRLRQAYSMYAQFRGPEFDATPAIDAREHLRELIAQYEQLAKEENLPALVEQIDQTLAQKLLVTADFYRRTNELLGAAYTYRYVAKAYPNTQVAQQAEVAMRDLPQWAIDSSPDPAITPAYAPGTASPTTPSSPRIIPAAARTDDRPGAFAQPDPGRPAFR
jgi:outer membrane assembly lipoprotein YfiO